MSCAPFEGCCARPEIIARHQRTHRAAGFSLVELLVAIGMFIVLATIFIPFILSRREAANRVACADNLANVRQGLRNYATDNAGRFPRVVYDVARLPNGYVAFTGPDADSPFTPDSPVQPNDVTASLWLLVRGGYVTPNRFICPSTSDVQDPGTSAAGLAVPVTARGNFRGAFRLSYSFASPFSAAPEYRVNDDLPWDFALMADRNPGVLAASAGSSAMQLAEGNSRNHGGAGQNVLHPGGHVSFEKTPYCGVGHDNIYTALADKPLAADTHPPADGIGLIGRSIGPAWNLDSYLVPTELDRE